MRRPGALRAALVVLAVCAIGGAAVTNVPLQASDALPERLSDREFWALITSASEPNGNFTSDNLLSNEPLLQHVIPELLTVARPGQVYLGVGPEQNFTYISALNPAMSFIVDVRRENLDLHLMYKALFELATDRNDFVSKLFSRVRAADVDRTSSPAQIFAAYAAVDPSEAIYRENLRAIKDDLVVRHGFMLSADDLAAIDHAFHAFFEFGPGLRYSSTIGSAGRRQPTYADLMAATDGSGRPHGFLSTEEAFEKVKAFQVRNLIVPVVGNFGGPRALRAVSGYVRSRGATVSAFYLSNVEQYLKQSGLWRAFCANLRTLPVDETSTFIHVRDLGRAGIEFVSELGPMASEIEVCRPR